MKKRYLGTVEVSAIGILHQKPYIVPIPGMKRRERLEENRGAAEIVLSAEELMKIDLLLKK